MRAVKRWRYYCDFCKKAGGSKFHMAKHEKGCTLNVARECGFCKLGEMDQQSMADLITALGAGKQEGLDALTAAADECPACILAAIRQSRINEVPDDVDANTLGAVIPGWVDFSFKDAAAAFWAAHNEGQHDDRDAGYYEADY